MGAEPIIIGDVEKFSIVDFPEHIAAVVFMQGCVWRCPFCYNTSLQQLGAKPESNWTFEKLMALLERRKGIIDAVVFSGGVASNAMLREACAGTDAVFAQPQFSTDNAMGIAVLAALQEGM